MQRTVDSSAERRYRFKSDGRQSRRSRAETVGKAAEEGRQSTLPDTKSNSKFILAAGKDRHYAAQTVLTVFVPFGTVAGSTPARRTSGMLPHLDQKKQKGGVTGKCVQKTFHLNRNLACLINEFADEHGMRHKQVVEAAVVEYLEKYGYLRQVELIKHRN